jgi:osmoprotectant transport system ATP-binding protein
MAADQRAPDRSSDHPAEPTGDVMIRLDRLGKRYRDGTVAVDDVTLEVRRGEMVMLVGPSGGGKSTTLRLINRLIEPTSGRIWLDGRDVTEEDPEKLRRGIGYVIQRIGLFPHRTVEQNVATVPGLLSWDRERTRRRVTELLELVGLEPGTYARRYPNELSGGQQQRVGVARALAADPPVLLMDEPFGAVDPIARDRLQEQFRRIQADLHKTVVFVTHDIDEAVRLGDRIAVLGPAGKLQQYADPSTLLAAPANEQVAAFVGADRGIRRMSVTPVTQADLEHPPTVDARHEDRVADGAVVLGDDGDVAGVVRAGRVVAAPRPVPLGASLREAFAALAGVDTGFVPVVEDGRYVGTVTPDSIYRALRHTAHEAAPDAGREAAAARS